MKKRKVFVYKIKESKFADSEHLVYQVYLAVKRILKYYPMKYTRIILNTGYMYDDVIFGKIRLSIIFELND